MSEQAEVSQVSAYSVDEFCHRHRISRGSFYNLLKAGQGPRIMKAGNRTLVSTEAAADWRRLREQQPAHAA